MKFSIKYRLLVSVLALSGAIACQNSSSEGQDTSGMAELPLEQTPVNFNAEQYNLAGLKSGKVTEREISAPVKLNGRVSVSPEGEALVSAPFGGYLRSPGRLAGQAVRKGEVLAVLENPEFVTMQEEYLESRSRTRFLKAEFERQSALREADVNAEKTYQRVVSEYETSKARTAGLEKKIRMAGIDLKSVRRGDISSTGRVYSPIAGFISESKVKRGAYVKAEDVLFAVVDKEKRQLSLRAFESDLPGLEEGQSIRFSLARGGRKQYGGTVMLIGKVAGEDKTVPVYASLGEESSGKVLPGMNVKANVATATARRLTVPDEAIVQLDNKDYLVEQKREGQGYVFRLRAVNPGISQDGYTAVSISRNFDVANTVILTDNAYAVLSALRNSAEEE
ncbi:hemolysin D (plasmid) [Fulvitalea axinellae]|uniref:Hemolysin D n=1 Tax=Fulvitalea axinellae TaxID=1182444 RepID=A0AAU9D5V4_9BACT|nr:hemolysin D [Fulvitalea axinellae]